MTLEELQAEKANLEHQFEALKNNANAVSGALQLVNNFIQKELQKVKDLEEKAKAEVSSVVQEIKEKL